MKYVKNHFSIEKIKAIKLAKKFKTPAYCYSFKRIKDNVINFKKAFKSVNPLICFSVKSNSNFFLLKEMNKFGLGADVVSKGELFRALKSGIEPKKIVFSGVGKTYDELRYAIEKKILLINAESKNEILIIEKIAKSKKRIVNIGLRLNPNTDAKTLSQISTGKKENKFGVDTKMFLYLVNYIKNSKYLRLECLSVHIGSQILDHKPYIKVLNIINKIVKKSGHNFSYIDLGGGMGIDYLGGNKKLNLRKYSISIKKFLKNHNSKIIFEPGRSIIGNAAILLSKITYIKKGFKKDFVILDTAMNDFIRPALYKSVHRIIPIIINKKKSKRIYEFVGPICESTDKFLTLKNYQKLKENDFLGICDVGAYGMSLSSNYNLRTKPIEILIKGSETIVINKRQKLKDLI